MLLNIIKSGYIVASTIFHNQTVFKKGYFIKTTVFCITNTGIPPIVRNLANDTYYLARQFLEKNGNDKLTCQFYKFNKDEFIVRLHIGLEDPKDLINDLKKSLKKIK